MAINAVAAYRQAEMDALRDALAGYAAVAQSKWHAWRARYRLEDRLPADFNDVLEPILRFADGLFGIAQVNQTARWSPTARRWQ
jgi:hypothetical protein